MKSKRLMSPHVCARWYRPPEVILLEQDYGQAIDIWAVGAILAELLHVTNSVKNASFDGAVDMRRHLFPGACCHPMTPVNDNDFKLDQLRIILGKLGKLNDDDTAFISAPEALKYLMKNNKDVPTAPFTNGQKMNPIRSKFAAIQTPGLVNMLDRMLQFNPGFRPTAHELLQHPMFDSVREPAKE